MPRAPEERAVVARGSPPSSRLVPRATPVAWRLTAAIVLIGTLVTGVAADWAGSAAALVVIAALVVVLYVAPLMQGSRRPPLPPVEDATLATLPPLPGITVLVAARDEAAVIEHLIDDLGAQTHRDPDGSPRFELVVVDDRSLDGTAEVARRTAERVGLAGVTRVVRRGVGYPAPGAQGVAAVPRGTPNEESRWPAEVEVPAGGDGKGAALATLAPSGYRYEVVAVLDADARIDPSYLLRMAGYVARGARALTARRRIFPAHAVSGFAGLLRDAQADEQTVDGEIQCGRWALGGCSEFRGNGMVLTRELLEACGGWPEGALCEDLDLSTRAAALGVPVGWAVDVPVWEEPVLDLGRLWRQRLRWGEGTVRRELELTGMLLRSRGVGWKRRLDYLAYGLQTVTPLIWLGSLLGAAIGGRWDMPVALLLVYLAAGFLLAADALRWEAPSGSRALARWERPVRAVRVTLFSALWVPVLGVAWAKVALGDGRPRFVKTTHAGAPEGWHPESSAAATTADPRRIGSAT